MSHDEEDDWDESEVPEDHTERAMQGYQEQIQKMLAEMEKKAEKAMRYLELEGFVEKTDIPGAYKYTPEGLVLAREQYKKMKEAEGR